MTNENTVANDTQTADTDELTALTSEIVAAYVSNNSVPVSDLPRVIRDIHQTLVGLRTGGGEAEKPTPAVSVKKSVQQDYITCLECGKQQKMLKRHLKTAHGMTPEEYRERWGLSVDYPMVAPSYAEKRSELAKQIGLGTKASRKGSENA